MPAVYWVCASYTPGITVVPSPILIGPDDDEDPVAALVPDEDVPDEVAAEEHAASRKAATVAISISTCRLRFSRSENHFIKLLRSCFGMLCILLISCLFPEDLPLGI
jgi:hypothetical protein